jgi:hypothetical protein
VFIKLWLEVNLQLKITILLLWLIEPEVFQMPQLHKHFYVMLDSTISKAIILCCDSFGQLHYVAGKGRFSRFLAIGFCPACSWDTDSVLQS